MKPGFPAFHKLAARCQNWREMFAFLYSTSMRTRAGEVSPRQEGTSTRVALRLRAK
jgi:hypothetical protein